MKFEWIVKTGFDTYCAGLQTAASEITASPSAMCGSSSRDGRVVVDVGLVERQSGFPRCCSILCVEMSQPSIS